MGALLGPYRDWQTSTTPYQAMPKGRVSGNQILNWILDHLTDVLDAIAAAMAAISTTTSETFTVGSGGTDGALRLRAPSGGPDFTSELTAVSPTANRVVTLPDFDIAFAAMPGLGLAWNAGVIDISPAADVDWQGFKITNLGLPTLAADATTKAYVDALIAGLYPKIPVRVATAAALPAYTRTGNIMTADGNGDINVTGPGIDGVVTLVNGDRLLVKDGAAGADNGIYVLTSIGTAAAPWIMTRASDADVDAEVRAGLWVVSDEGATQADTVWLLVTNNPITLNTTALTFSEITGIYRITAGAGLTSSGNTLDIGAGTGIQVNANDVQIAAGGVGVNEIAAAIAGAGLVGGAGAPLDVGAGTAITVGVDTVGVTPLGITDAELAAGAVTAGKIGIGGVSASNQFAAGVVDATALAAAVAGAGLVGGAGAPLDVGAGTAITVGADTVGVTPLGITDAELAASAVTAGKIGIGGISAANQFAAGVVDEAALNASVAGAGLVGGGGAPLDVGAGTGISVAAGSVGIAAGGVGATELAAAVAGAGLVGGGGAALAVGAGAGIQVNANDVQITTDAISALSTWKRSVRAATTGALPASTRVGNVLTADAVGALPAQDGIALSVADRLLVSQEVLGANNGIYSVTDLGSGGTAWILTRSSESGTSTEMPPNHLVPIREGTLYADQAFWCTNNAITLNTTALVYERVTGLGKITAGDGIAATADTLDIAPADFAGVGLEVSGGDIRLAAQGTGIAGGAGAVLSLAATIADNLHLITKVVEGGEVGNVIAIELETQSFAGAAQLQAVLFRIIVSDAQYDPTANGTTTITLTGGGDGAIRLGSGTATAIVETAAGNGRVDLDITEAAAKTVYLHFEEVAGSGWLRRQAAISLTFA